jgi:DNA processing protein
MLGVQSLGPVMPRRVAETGGQRPDSVASRAAVETASDAECLVSRRPVTDQGDDLERKAWVILLSVSGLGPVTFGALLNAFGSARQVLAVASGEAGAERLREVMSLAGPRAAERPETGSLAEGGGSTGRGPDGAGLDTHSRPNTGGDPIPGPGRPGDGDASGERSMELSVSMACRILEAVQTGPQTLERLTALGLDVVTLEDPEFPARLRLVEMPPPLLFVRGNVRSLNRAHMIAVVGTRRPTDKGRLAAGWIGSALANAGAAVVSGMAVGIDGVAHAAVVGEGGATVAVLGGGHARLFPRAHERLGDAIVAAGGAVVSELSPDTSPSRGTFPRRNRLVSGMSDATVVVEAGRRSGALITAGWALEQGRECFLVPGPLDAPMSAGCLAFLRSFPGQARVVCGIPELVEDLGLVPFEGVATPAEVGGNPASGRGVASAPSAESPMSGQAALLASLSPLERTLAEALRNGPATADELARNAGGSPAAILSALTLLELRGLVTAGYGRYMPAGQLSRGPAASAGRLRGRN